ncbi:ubiquitin domain-containing protein DSK2b [Tanacetum coccineum]|uniref:Ubiquitin domain-containing protein DSK2b n=1 Tax=Tanacetum coccineum TaxID=301880 RepID=A0ABQ4Y8C2_9ASTR
MLYTVAAWVSVFVVCYSFLGIDGLFRVPMQRSLLHLVESTVSSIGKDAGQADRGTAPPQARYIGELTHLQQMGFLDNRENLQALEATAGNVSAAVEQLLGNPN